MHSIIMYFYHSLKKESKVFVLVMFISQNYQMKSIVPIDKAFPENKYMNVDSLKFG